LQNICSIASVGILPKKLCNFYRNFSGKAVELAMSGSHLVCGLFVALAVAFAVADARVSSIRPSIGTDQIRALDLTRTQAQLVKWHPDWSPSRVESALREYRRFLNIGAAHGQVYLIPPSVIDEVWHAHILDTVNYMRDTTLIFGSYLHHVASEQPQSMGTPDHDTFIKASALYSSMFGEEQAAEIWGVPASDNTHVSPSVTTSSTRKKIRPIQTKPRLELNCGPSPPQGACGYDPRSQPKTMATAFTSKSWVVQNVTAGFRNDGSTAEGIQALVSTLQIAADGSATMICTSGCAPATAGPQTIKLSGNFSEIPNTNEVQKTLMCRYSPPSSGSPGTGCPSSYYSGFFPFSMQNDTATALSLTADPCLLTKVDGSIVITGSIYVNGGDYGDGMRYAVVAS
jgi:hypothetical protein